ncbi:glycine zipper domain-containing protein [Crenobacter sp. SG2305]|uniref:glycine zipper domain-containing protein n=1 Tax=Crenobacter oryzisoli TaxID=3056844 RepID=UPI0025AA85BB|nr:glycine zipper domain-containing protein [Crenobacter sp. SG2305]MDN0085257.1 glycine zipper domain-containing protein [Crenobacter sp. SG2305]
MNARILLPAALFLALSGMAHASGSTILGGALGGAAGAAVGESVGGRDGAVIGGALGGSVGAAIGYDNREPTRYVEPRRRDYPRYREWDDDDDQGWGRGYFCPPGQAKKGRC